MKIKTKPISIITTLLIASLFFVFLFPSFKSEGGTLTETYLYLSRIKANLDGSAGNEVEMILAFAPSQAFSSPTTVEIYFPPGAANADVTKWCRTVGSLTATGVASGSPDLAGTADIDFVLPGTLSATCAQGSGGSGDSITITGVNALTAGETYGVKLENSTGALGTATIAGTNTIAVQVSDGSNSDGIAFGVYLIGEDTVEVSAQVSAAPSVDCTLTPTTVSMGVLYPGGVILTESVADQIQTGSTGYGYYWAAYGLGNGTDTAGLYYSGGPYLIESSSTVVDLSGGNSEGFGITVEPPTGATVPSDFQTGTSGQFGGLEFGTDGARLILYRDSAAGSVENADVNYGARASTLALGGTYYEYVTYVCGGYY